MDVRVILEKNVYGNPVINNPTIKKLQAAGVLLIFSDPMRYTFTHAKFWIIDDDYVISTGNWTKSFFEKNREYFYRGNDPITREALEQVFLSDQNRLAFVDPRAIPEHLVLSPVDSREKITHFLTSAQKSIVVFVQSFDDPGLFALLESLKTQKGIDIKICTADNDQDTKNR